MPLKFLEDRQLYSDYSHYAANFSWPSRGDGSQLLIFHAYWSMLLTKHHELSLKSLCVTQSPPYEVWIWMAPAQIAANGSFINSFASIPGVKFKEYDETREKFSTTFADIELPVPKTASNRADVFRMLVLEKYGGVYFDLDVVFLKDIRPLCEFEFFYQWSNQPYGNTAILTFKRNSPAIKWFNRRVIELGTFHPAWFLRFDDPRMKQIPTEVLVLPSFVFDPAWISHDLKRTTNAYCNNLDDVFKVGVEIQMKEFFPASYAYHWHNQWAKPLVPGSIMASLYAEIADRFAVRCPC